ncbi:hypothetical protein RRX38_22130 [Pseudomonas sp. DTU_2021_1001937_2_SI_NGA_ILE_001]|uniref:hypothetical protein n=1 Tax=Pseudomonas sp. DTU_2021_1001937_2_SI_NGA_ILE_001 TaxID=3077589 RepID=UPI0025CEECB3|nr:hypothetical protein [Pseudomonas sp. DTU_2021_1001937_2_SI_NGA_ILE_001]WNW13744.1 hypothetical protein RRX38_22130 [Pseudomonas sp. DTU_2021_1001937_2_SI_NGA_ILE_001]
MKIDSKPASPNPGSLNEIGLLAWSLLADNQLNMVGGGIPGQPAPDTPQPPQPAEPGEPTLPDEPPPTPVA